MSQDEQKMLEAWRDRLAKRFGTKPGSDSWKRLTTMSLQAQIDYLQKMLA